MISYLHFLDTLFTCRETRETRERRTLPVPSLAQASPLSTVGHAMDRDKIMRVL